MFGWFVVFGCVGFGGIIVVVKKVDSLEVFVNFGFGFVWRCRMFVVVVGGSGFFRFVV